MMVISGGGGHVSSQVTELRRQCAELEDTNAELLAACKAVEQTRAVSTIAVMKQVRAAIKKAEGE